MGATRRLAAASRAPLSYPEVGATAGPLPAGYRHVRRTRDLGSGDDVFQDAARLLLGWEVHRRAGLVVEATTHQVREGSVVVLGVGFGRLRLRARAGSSWSSTSPAAAASRTARCGVIPRRARSCSRSARTRPVGWASRSPRSPGRRAWWSRLGGPGGRLVQDAITRRYLAALQRTS